MRFVLPVFEMFNIALMLATIFFYRKILILDLISILMAGSTIVADNQDEYEDENDDDDEETEPAVKKNKTER